MSDHKSDRRGFIKSAVVAGGAAAAAGALNSNVANADDQTKKPVDQGSERAAGYRETAHIREYYRLARF